MKKINKVIFTIVFWLWQLTWGGLMTIPGLFVTGIAILCGGTPHKNGCSYIVEIGGNWGGLEIGAVALCGRYSKDNMYWFNHTRAHEFGHALQQLIFGPFQLFVVWIPSALRYWYDRIEKKHAADRGPDWYDSIWFEGTATNWGKEFILMWEVE